MVSEIVAQRISLSNCSTDYKHHVDGHTCHIHLNVTSCQVKWKSDAGMIIFMIGMQIWQGVPAEASMSSLEAKEAGALRPNTPTSGPLDLSFPLLVTYLTQIIS